MDLRTRYERGTTGRFGEALDRSDPMLRSWSAALRAQHARAAPSEVAMPTVAELAALDASAEATVLALGEALRDALVRADAERARAMAPLLEQARVTHEHDVTDKAVGQLWLAAFGLGPPVHDVAELTRRARDLGQPHLVVEATSLGALLASSRGEHAEALAAARVASRMARTEALPQPEYLANMVLARLRRLLGQPHLAVHILQALARFTPAGWNRWVAFERAISGDIDAKAPSVRALARAIQEGDPVEPLVQALRTDFAELAPHRRTTETMVALLSPACPVPSELRPWFEGGADAPVPLGLHGLALHHREPAFQAEPIWVHAQAQGGARRLLSVGLGLLHSSVVIFEPGQRGRARTDGAIAALLFAREPVPEPVFFESLYGFAYKPANHQGARDTLYYRIRARLGDHGELIRDDAGIAIRLNHDVAVPDPRFRPPQESALLTLVAQLGSASARQMATRLGIPLRTAQHTLKALAKEGICVVERAGRELRYRVEDTTFCEPTVG